ncbi:MAG: GGDEF domain-containing protein [Anaeromyxobacteraceae bacterium]
MDDDTRITGYVPPARPGEACLVVLHAPVGRLLGARVALGAREVVLGRDEECALVLDADDVSRRHARVRSGGECHLLEDLGSTNGTFVGDERVTARALLPGDLVRLGSVVLKYLAGDDLEALYHAELRRLTSEDPLTGLANKRAFAAALEREVARAHRHTRPLALALLDLDHFKAVNDLHGHLAGDHVLREVARAVAPLVGPEELFARVGGEELAIVLPDAPLDRARAFAEEVRARVAAAPLAFEGAPVALTVSVGVAALAPGEAPDALVARADARLYDAKRGGRNRVSS